MRLHIGGKPGEGGDKESAAQGLTALWQLVWMCASSCMPECPLDTWPYENPRGEILGIPGILGEPV